MEILVTDGAGYIGCHTCLELLQAGYDLVVIDNLTRIAAPRRAPGKAFREMGWQA